MGPRSQVVDGGPDPACEGALIRGKDMPGHVRRHSAVSFAKTAELIDLTFGLWTLVCQRKHRCPHGIAHWRNLANMIEPSICGGNAALCQVTLTTCYYYYELVMMYEVWTHLSLSLQVKDMAESIQPGIIVLACGSYRRGRPTCGDVDILITHPDGLSHQGIFKPLIARLHETGVKCFLLFSTVLSYLARSEQFRIPTVTRDTSFTYV